MKCVKKKKKKRKEAQVDQLSSETNQIIVEL